MYIITYIIVITINIEDSNIMISHLLLNIDNNPIEQISTMVVNSKDNAKADGIDMYIMSLLIMNTITKKNKEITNAEVLFICMSFFLFY